MADRIEGPTPEAPRTLFSLGRPGSTPAEGEDVGAEDGRPNGLPPALAAMAVPAATLYADPSVVEPLPQGEGPRWEVAEPRVGTVEDVDPVEPDPVAGPPAPTADPAPAPGSAPERRSRGGVIVGAAGVALVLVVGIVVVLLGGGDDADEVSSGDRAAAPPSTIAETDAGPPAPTEPAPVVEEPPVGEAPAAEAAPPPTTAPATTAPAPTPAPPPTTRVTLAPPPPAIVVPAPSVAPATPAQLTVSLAPTIGSQLEVERGKAGYVTIGNAGGAIGSFTITGGGLAVSMPQGTVQPGATVTVNVTDTAGTDRVTFLDVRGSGFAQRYEVLVR